MFFGYPRPVPSQNHVFENAKRTSVFCKVGGQVRHQRPGPRWTGLVEVGGDLWMGRVTLLVANV